MILLSPTPPVFGRNYDVGWIGFVHHHSFIADGIDWFTRFYRKNDEPAVSHVFGVTGPNECIEANADGVDRDSLDQYFHDPKYTVYLRKPFRWTPDMGRRIVAKAATFIGEPYDFENIVADAISNTLLGHLANEVSQDAFDRWITKAMSSPKKMICDKVWVEALNSTQELNEMGTLSEPAVENNPQKLFSDERIFAQSVTVIRGMTPVDSSKAVLSCCGCHV